MELAGGVNEDEESGGTFRRMGGRWRPAQGRAAGVNTDGRMERGLSSCFPGLARTGTVRANPSMMGRESSHFIASSCLQNLFPRMKLSLTFCDPWIPSTVYSASLYAP